jgi:phosphotriesterase-related protein
MISAAAEVSAMTGIPIISHTHLATHGHQQVDLVERHGCHADCMVVGHSGDRDDSAYQISLAQRGAFVGLDRFGLEMILPDELRIKNLMELVRAGHRDQVLVSQDHVVCMLGRAGLDLPIIAPHWSLTTIFKRILPRLIELGLSQDDVETILVQNPMRLFANAAKLSTRRSMPAAAQPAP